MSEGDYFLAHRWDWCDMCGPHVVCGLCGNNCCNGGTGELPSPGLNVVCPACESAYALQSDGVVPPDLAERDALEVAEILRRNAS